jgi:hypothetical protein
VIDLLLNFSLVERRLALRVDQRVVTKIPLTELWDESGTIAGGRIRNLNENTLIELIRSGSVRFVVADCGLKLDWISREKHFDFSSQAPGFDFTTFSLPVVVSPRK